MAPDESGAGTSEYSVYTSGAKMGVEAPIGVTGFLETIADLFPMECRTCATEC
jgi:hypothetical protein